MADRPDETRVQVPLNEETIAKVDELAERMKVGRGRMASMLVEAGIANEQWLIKLVTSKYLEPIRDVFKGWEDSQPETT